MASGIGPFGTASGSSTAARSAARSPARKAASILLNLSCPAHRSASEFMVASRPDGWRMGARPPRRRSASSACQAAPLAEREALLLGQDGLRAQRLSEAHGTEGDLARIGPVQANPPTVVRAVEV